MKKASIQFILYLKSSYINPTLFKYLIVGAINTVVSMGLTLLSYNVFGIKYSLAYSGSTAVAIICSFILNKKFTFQSKKGWKEELFKFLLVCLIAFGVSFCCLHLAVIKFKIPVNFSFIIAMISYTLVGYGLNKKFVFLE